MKNYFSIGISDLPFFKRSIGKISLCSFSASLQQSVR